MNQARGALAEFLLKRGVVREEGLPTTRSQVSR